MRRTGMTAEQQQAATARYLHSIVDRGECPLVSRAITETGAAPDAETWSETALGRLLDGVESAVGSGESGTSGGDPRPCGTS